MADPCTHPSTNKYLDMPIADPETYEVLGRFDVSVCAECGEILDRSPTTYSPPA